MTATYVHYDFRSTFRVPVVCQLYDNESNTPVLERNSSRHCNTYK